MTDLVERLKSNILFNWPHLANYGDDMIEAATEIERLQAENERIRKKAAICFNNELNLDADVAKLEARQELLEKVVEAATACIEAWDDAKWPSPIPLRKALAALKEQNESHQ